MRRGLIPLREFESHRLRQNAKRPQVGAVLKVDNRDIGGTLARGFDDLADAAMDRARDLLVGVAEKLAGRRQVADFAGGFRTNARNWNCRIRAASCSLPAFAASAIAAFLALSKRRRHVLLSTFPDGVATRNRLETFRSRDMMRSKTTFMTLVPTGAGLHSSSDHLRLASLRSVPGGISTRLPF